MITLTPDRRFGCPEVCFQNMLQVQKLFSTTGITKIHSDHRVLQSSKINGNCRGDPE